MSYGGHGYILDVFGTHGANGACKVGFLHLAVADNDYLVEYGGVFKHHHVDGGTTFDLHGLGFVAQIGELYRSLGICLDGVVAIGIGSYSAATAYGNDGGANQGFSFRVGDNTRNGDLLRI